LPGQVSHSRWPVSEAKLLPVQGRQAGMPRLGAAQQKAHTRENRVKIGMRIVAI
jgi:hypothetical protein